MKDSTKRGFEYKSLLTTYTFLLFCIMPIVVTPWRAELFYDGKLVFVALVTMVYLSIGVYHWVRNRKDYSFNINRINYSRYEIVIGFFAVLSILSTIFSVNLGLSIWGQPHSREGLVSILVYALIFYLFYRRFTFSKSLLIWILASASLVSIYGILQYYGIAPGLHEFVKDEWERGLTTIGNRNFVGTYALMMLTLGVGMVIIGKGTYSFAGMSPIQGMSTYGIPIFIACGLIFGLLIASMTRSAWIGFAVVFALYFIFSLRSKEMLIKWAILLVLFAGIFGVMNTSKDSQVKERAKTIVEDAKDIKNDSVGSDRMYYWKRTRAFMFDRPWLGSGPDTYGEIFKDEYGADKIKLHYEKAHNEYLQIAMTLGYPALGLYLALVMMVLWGLVKVMRRGSVSQFAPIVFCCIVGYLVQAFFNISVISTAPMYWAMLGIGARLGEEVQLFRGDVADKGCNYC